MEKILLPNLTHTKPVFTVYLIMKNGLMCAEHNVSLGSLLLLLVDAWCVERVQRVTGHVWHGREVKDSVMYKE